MDTCKPQQSEFSQTAARQAKGHVSDFALAPFLSQQILGHVVTVSGPMDGWRSLASSSLRSQATSTRKVCGARGSG
jgi:hypothetical protein